MGGMAARGGSWRLMAAVMSRSAGQPRERVQRGDGYLKNFLFTLCIWLRGPQILGLNVSMYVGFGTLNSDALVYIGPCGAPFGRMSPLLS